MGLGALSLWECGIGAVSDLSPLSCCLSQGLSDFCSSPDTYVLNLTQEETGLGSGDPIGPVLTLDPQASAQHYLGWGGVEVPSHQPGLAWSPEALSTSLVKWKRGRKKMLDSGEGAGPEGWRIWPFGETRGSSLFKGSQGVWRRVSFGLWPEQESLGTGLVADLRMPGHWDHKTVLSWGGAPGPEGGKTEP